MMLRHGFGPLSLNPARTCHRHGGPAAGSFSLFVIDISTLDKRDRCLAVIVVLNQPFPDAFLEIVTD